MQGGPRECFHTLNFFVLLRRDSSQIYIKVNCEYIFGGTPCIHTIQFLSKTKVKNLIGQSVKNDWWLMAKFIDKLM